MDQTRWNTHPSRATTRQNFWSALAGCHVLERRNPAVGESDELARIRNAWREPRITKRIVQRRSEIFVQGRKRIVRVGGIVNVKPGLRLPSPHVAHIFS